MKAIKIRFPSDLGVLEYLVLIGILIWIRLPAAFSLSDHPLARLAALLPLILVIIKIWVQKFFNHQYVLPVMKTLFYPFALYVLVLGFSFFQAAMYNSVSMERLLGNSIIPFLVLLFGISISSRIKSEQGFHTLQGGIFLAVVLYLVLNFAIYASGIRIRADVFIEPRPAVLPSYLGLVFPRITFPMATGVNTFGYTAGLALTGGAVCSWYAPGKIKILGVVGMLLAAAGMLLVDSRAALLFSFLAIGLGLRRKLKHSWLIVFLSLGLPLLVLYILQNLPLEWIGLISRSGTDALTLSNRTVIWSAALDDFSTFKVQNIIGWGYRGQIPSGIMEQYAFLFSNFQEVTAIPLHNAYLQHSVEYGYIGLGIFLVLLINLLGHIGRKTGLRFSYWSIVLQSMLVYLIVCSSLDAVLSVDSQETFSIFLLIATSTIFARIRPPEKSGKSPLGGVD